MNFLSKNNCVPFMAHKIKGLECVWINKDLVKLSEEAFSEMYSYGIPSAQCFSGLSFDETLQTQAVAERYGGAGCGFNGGGARSANIHGVQVKGGGANCLVGSTRLSWHSHGAQNLSEAACEVIYADVLQRTLPLGVVDCLGIILTDKNSAYFTNDVDASEFLKCWGALLIRNTCVRPAHFLRSRNFTPQTPYAQMISNDVVRVRRIHKELAEHFGKHSEFVRTAGQFLSNCANQFAFARVARIAHMATTPSNIAVDGKWLDLASVSFLDGGKNYAIDNTQRPFLTEHLLVEETIYEFVETYAKFNEIDINCEPLIKYFREAMAFYFHKHCNFIFGIEKEDWPEKGSSAECDSITDIVYKIIHENTELVVGLPKKTSLSDTVIGMIQGFFIGFEGSNCYAVGGINIPKKTFDAFAHLLSTIYKCNSQNVEQNRFIMLCALKSLKRAYCSAFYYRGRVKSQLDKFMLSDANPTSIKNIIEDSMSVSKWVFYEDDKFCVTLYSNKEILIRYSAISGCFSMMTSFRSREYKFYSFKKLISMLKKLDDHLFVIQEFDFRSYLLEIAKTIDAIERRTNDDNQMKIIE